MKIPHKFHAVLKRMAAAIIRDRDPDLIVGEKSDPYLYRWWVIPRNPFFNIYLHVFFRSDDDRALHDHPWLNMSILISGQYKEHTPRGQFLRKERGIYCRLPTAAHRIELFSYLKSTFLAAVKGNKLELGGEMIDRPVLTLFITGPRIREWGFYCPQGWRVHTEFLKDDANKTGNSVTGKGCA